MAICVLIVLCILGCSRGGRQEDHCYEKGGGCSSNPTEHDFCFWQSDSLHATETCGLFFTFNFEEFGNVKVEISATNKQVVLEKVDDGSVSLKTSECVWFLKLTSSNELHYVINKTTAAETGNTTGDNVLNFNVLQPGTNEYSVLMPCVEGVFPPSKHWDYVVRFKPTEEQFRYSLVFDNDLLPTTIAPPTTTTAETTTNEGIGATTTKDTDQTTRPSTDSSDTETTKNLNHQTSNSATTNAEETTTETGGGGQTSQSPVTTESQNVRQSTDPSKITSTDYTSNNPNDVSSTIDYDNSSITSSMNWSTPLTPTNFVSTINSDETTTISSNEATTIQSPANSPQSLLDKAEQLQIEVDIQITEETSVADANEVNNHAIGELTEIVEDFSEAELTKTETVTLMATVSNTAENILSKDVDKDADLLILVDNIVKKSTENIQKEDVVEEEPVVENEAWAIYVVKEESTTVDFKLKVGGQTTVQVPAETLQGSSENGVENTNVVLAAYEFKLQDSVKIPASKFEESEADEVELTLISQILIIVIYPANTESEGVTFTQQITNSSKEKLLQKSHIARCVSINATTKNWTTSGCKAQNDGTSGNVTCECTHLTNFAILMQVVDFEISEYHQQNLRLITFIGSTISIFCLVLSLLVFLLIKSGQYNTDDSSTNVKGHRTERYHIHANLALSILLGQVTFVSGSGEAPRTIGCKVTAILLHFFFLAAFSWMLVEGLHLYNLVVKVFRTTHSRLGYYYMIGWGTPLLICVISVAAAYGGYGETKNCWLEMNNSSVIWAFVGPALFVVLVNIFVLIKVTRVISNLSNAQDHCKNAVSDKQTIIVCAKAVAVLLPILGLTWIFGILAFNQDTIIFQYVFVTTNSLQGFFLFIFHVVLNSETRSALIYKTGSIQTSVMNSSFSSSRKKRKHDDSGYSRTRTTSYSKMNSRSTPNNSVTSSNEWSKSMEMSQQGNKRSFRNDQTPTNSRPHSALSSSRISPALGDEQLHENSW